MAEAKVDEVFLLDLCWGAWGLLGDPSDQSEDEGGVMAGKGKVLQLSLQHENSSLKRQKLQLIV